MRWVRCTTLSSLAIVLLCLFVEPAHSHSNGLRGLDLSHPSIESSNTTFHPTRTVSSIVARAQPAVHTVTSTTPRGSNRVDITYGVLGALLILTGLPTMIQGLGNPPVSLLVVGLYSGGIVVSLTVLHVIVDGVYSPSATMRGVYFIGSVVAGMVGGILGVIWLDGAQHLAGVLGGFIIALYMLALKDSTLVSSVGGSYILIAALTALGFVLTIVPKTSHSTLVFSTVALGATAFILGVDCFTTGGIKELYVYNFGIALLPRLDGYFAIHEAIKIELGALAAAFICGTAWQLRLYLPLLLDAMDEEDTTEAIATAEELEEGERTMKSPKQPSRKLLWDENYSRGWLVACMVSCFPGSASPITASTKERWEKYESPRLPSMDLGSYNSDVPTFPVTLPTTPPPPPPPPPQTLKRSESKVWLKHLATRQFATTAQTTFDRFTQRPSTSPRAYSPESLRYESHEASSSSLSPSLSIDSFGGLSLDDEIDRRPISQSPSSTTISVGRVKRREYVQLPKSRKVMDLSSPTRRRESQLPESRSDWSLSSSSAPSPHAGPSDFPSGSSPLFSSLLYTPPTLSRPTPILSRSPSNPTGIRRSTGCLAGGEPAAIPRSGSRGSMQQSSLPPTGLRNLTRMSLQSSGMGRSMGRSRSGPLPPGAGVQRLDKESWLDY